MENSIKFAADFARSIGAGTDDRQLLETVFNSLSQSEELASPIRDTWGNWDFQFSRANRSGLTYRPWLDESLLLNSEPLPNLWPDGHPFALVLTHDMDYCSEIALSTKAFLHRLKGAKDARGKKAKLNATIRAAARYLLQPLLRKGRPDPLWHFEDWLSLESKYGFRSSFYFQYPAADPAYWDCHYGFDDFLQYNGRRVRVREMIREIADAGWDVGVHGSYRSALNADILRSERESLERASGKPAPTTRQHYLHFDSHKTPIVQEKAGISADTTLGFNRNIGFRSGTCFPFLLWDHDSNKPTNVLEISQIVMDGGLFTSNALEYDTDQAVGHVVELMDRVQTVGGCLTLNFHPTYLNIPRYWDTYSQVLEEASRRNAWGCSAADVDTWWRTTRLSTTEPPA